MNYQRIRRLSLIEKVVIPISFLAFIGISLLLYFVVQENEVQEVLNDCETQNDCRSLSEDFEKHFVIPTLTAVDNHLHVDLIFEPDQKTEEDEELFFYTTISATLFRKTIEIGSAEKDVEIHCVGMKCDPVPLIDEDVILGRGQEIDLKISAVKDLYLKGFQMITSTNASAYLEIIALSIIILLDVVLACLLFVFAIKGKITVTKPFKFFVFAVILFYAPLDVFSYIVETWVFPMIHVACFGIYFTVIMMLVVHTVKVVTRDNMKYLTMKFVYLLTFVIYGFFMVTHVIGMFVYIIYEWSNPICLDTEVINGINICFQALSIIFGLFVIIWLVFLTIYSFFFVDDDGDRFAYLFQQGMLIFILLFSIIMIGCYPQQYITKSLGSICFFDILIQYFFVVFVYLFIPVDTSFGGSQSVYERLID